LREVYHRCCGEIVAALTEAAEVDREVNRISHKKPYDLEQSNGDGRNLENVELAADSGSASCRDLVAAVALKGALEAHARF
jgi:hypothetical protein